jgi:Domain of unknown function (DUF222)/HNH endonuclease
MGAGQVVDRLTVKSALERFEAAAEQFASLSLEALSHTDLLAVADRLEALKRQQARVEHQLVGRLATECAPRDLGAKNMAEVLSRRLRISRAEARTRIADARLLAERTAMTGEKLEPLLPIVAAGVAAGTIGAEHVRIIRRFFAHLPAAVDAGTRAAAEKDLADIATGFTPEQLAVAADRLMTMLDQDGDFTEGDRARKRGLTLGKQGYDGMSRLSGQIDPELRATLEALFAKLAAPGVGNPETEAPRVDGTPTEEEIRADLRSPAQRRHDALKAAGRAVLASGKLGRHNGLPVTILISTTLQELESARGHAVTGGGTVLPMSEVIRLARHAHHYLAVFDKHTNVPLYLGRSRRTASPGQRLILYSRERGCTRPGCTASGYWSEVHHVSEWAHGGPTDIDNLTFACTGDHPMVQPGGWTTRKREDGQTEWLPPPHLDAGGPRTNDFHHPERFLTNRDSGNDGDDGDDSGDNDRGG